MNSSSLAKKNEILPSVFGNLLKPWNSWIDADIFNGGSLSVPAVNITDNKDDFMVSLAVPGMKKDDFDVNVDGNMITISCDKEEKKEEKDARFTRKEYNYSSFSRSFTLPDEITTEKIEARYEDGILKVRLPKKEEAKKKVISQHISVQ